jgi:hypothetical protein
MNDNDKRWQIGVHKLGCWGMTFLHPLTKACEEVGGIVWPRGGFGVILNTEEAKVFVVEPLDSLVVEIYVSDPTRAGQRIDVHTKAMVLRRNFHTVCDEVFHRVIGAMVSELKFVRSSPES